MAVEYNYTGGNFASFSGLPPHPFTTSERVTGNLIFNFSQALQPNTIISATDAMSALVSYSFTDSAGDTISSTDSPAPTVSIGPIFTYSDGSFSANVDVRESTSASRTVEIQLVGAGSGIGINGGGPAITNAGQVESASSPFGTWALASIVPATTSTDTPVYRFFDAIHGTQFLSSSSSEVASIQATRPDLTLEGVGLFSVSSTAAGAAPVYRFFDTRFGTHFYTSSAAEQATVAATRPDLTYEGIGFYEHTSQQTGDIPVYRFFETTNGTHFYTSSAAEQAQILASRPDLTYEGVGFYAPTS